MSEKEIIDKFHELYHNNHIGKSKWLGFNVTKSPIDCWSYQEIIYETQPDVIIECGTGEGGGTLFFACMLDFMGKSKIYSIDVDNLRRKLPYHPKIQYIAGSSVEDEVVKLIKQEIKSTDRVMVNLDSNHHKEHVLQEMKIYGELVTKGCYMIVEDGNINGHPVAVGWGEGPYEAVDEFLKENKDFVIDKSREKMLVTFNPNGYLLKA